MLGILFLAGLGWAVVNPTTGKAILERFPARERSFAMGVEADGGLTVGGIAALAVRCRPSRWPPAWRHALTVAALASLGGRRARCWSCMRRDGAGAITAEVGRARVQRARPLLHHSLAAGARWPPDSRWA